jgi:hypothetical protein
MEEVVYPVPAEELDSALYKGDRLYRVVLKLDNGGSKVYMLPYKYLTTSHVIMELVNADEEDGEVSDIPIPNIKEQEFLFILNYMKLRFPRKNVKVIHDPIKRPIETNDYKEIVGQPFCALIESLLDESGATPLDLTRLFNALVAANCLDIPGLVDLIACKIGCFIRGKNPEAIKHLFGVTDNITEEEQRAVRDKEDWIFEPSVTKPENLSYNEQDGDLDKYELYVAKVGMEPVQ